MKGLYVGIDPGLSGAIAFYDKAENLITVHDMPVVEIERNKKTKREANAHMLDMLFVGKQIERCVLERVGAMPGQGVTGMFSLGRTVGVIEGVLASRAVRVDIILPRQWQKAMSAREGKDANRARAMELFPLQANLFARKKDDGRAEAALMAVYASTL